jgi:hypothetical protein
MAKLSAHGVEVGRIEFLASRLAVMNDGVVLRDFGNGWKRDGKIKPHLTPEQALQILRGSTRGPAYTEYRNLLFAEAGKSLERRIRINTIISVSYHDPDGAWSDLEDIAHCPMALEDVQALCRAYERWVTEAKAARRVREASLASA